MQFLTKPIKLLLTFFSENFLNQNMFLIKVLEYIIYLKVYIKFCAFSSEQPSLKPVGF